MFTLSEPTSDDVAKFIASQRNLPFTYAEVGATRFDPVEAPRGFTLDHNRVLLGNGIELYERAVEALKQWRQFDLGWVTLVPQGVKLEKDAIVAVKARAVSTWSLSACRVVYTINEQGPVRRFGFAYGTLPDHVERGEERFLIEWNPLDNSVWYDILAFSQPRHPLVRLGSPVARKLQKRFARDSLAVMKSIANPV
ncbi:MAG TPA: DUF1990 domain-containing protein [Pyrinomonadaceae bacterium]|nr:DUF1990 domain-containing protein [Pyrinomonadaceae bacterium]